MNHQPFENWLLEDKPLSASEKQSLNAHLRECPSCVALTEVGLALKSAKMTEPPAGFVDRFRVRLEAKKQELRRRNAWGFLFLTLSVLALLAWTLWPILVAANQSPVGLAVSLFAFVSSLWERLQAIFQAGVVLLKVLPDFIPLYVFPTLLSFAVLWSVLWVFSLIKIAKIPQGA